MNNEDRRQKTEAGRQRHCEERSDEAISNQAAQPQQIASLTFAMTKQNKANS